MSNNHLISTVRPQSPEITDPSQGVEWFAQILIAHPISGYIAVVAVVSVTTFLVYGWDKRQAKTNGRRVPEKRLHLLAVLGGWPGALMGQSYFRHKTQKLEFKIVTWGAAALHVGLVGWCLYKLMAG
jgi:uncharacterized membrane protein YsdA (DUF1294 family)